MQKVSTATRITHNTTSLLDLILTDDKYVSDSGTLDHMISDHQPVFIVKKKGRNLKSSASSKGRSYKNLDLESFKQRLRNSNINHNFDFDDPNDLWEQLLKVITDDLDKNCPIRNFIIKNYRPDWINEQLLEQIRDRDYFYSKAKSTRDEDDWNIQTPFTVSPLTTPEILRSAR